jgi:phasin family protein
MAKTGNNGFFDAAKAFGDFRVPGVDIQAIVEAQRRNFEALTQANQLATEGFQAVVRRQVEIAQQALSESQGLIRDWAKPGSPEEMIAKNAELAKQAFEKGVANARELNEIIAKAGTDAFSVIARRLSESFDEVRLFAKKQLAAE